MACAVCSGIITSKIHFYNTYLQYSSKNQFVALSRSKSESKDFDVTGK